MTNRSIRVVLGACIAVTVLWLTGCNEIDRIKTQNMQGLYESGNEVEKAAPSPGLSTVQEGSLKSEEVINKFSQLLGGSAPVAEVMDYMDRQVNNVSNRDMDTMLIGLEELQKSFLKKLVFSYNEVNGDSEAYKDMKAGIEAGDVDKVQAEKWKILLKDTYSGGYKLFIYWNAIHPAIDYRVTVDKYGKYASDEMKNYLDIKAEESDEPSIKEGKLAIGLDKLAGRLAAVEEHMEKYPAHRITKNSFEQYLYYLGIYLKGSEGINFHVEKETQKVRSDVLESYRNYVAKYNGTGTSRIISKYMDLLEKSDYKSDSPDVQRFYSTIPQEAKKVFGNIEF